jgi:hypothetical protein
MAHIQGRRPHQGTLFPAVLDDLVPNDHVCHVIDAFVGSAELSFATASISRHSGTSRRPKCVASGTPHQVE